MPERVGWVKQKFITQVRDKIELSLLVIYMSQLQQYYKAAPAPEVAPEAATPPSQETQRPTTQRPSARDILGLKRTRPITAQRSLEIEVESFFNDNSTATSSLCFWQVRCSLVLIAYA